MFNIISNNIKEVRILYYFNISATMKHVFLFINDKHVFFQYINDESILLYKHLGCPLIKYY